MINLFNYIKESIFDDEEDQFDKIDSQVFISQLQDEKCMFRQEYDCVGWRGPASKYDMERTTWNNGVLYIPSESINHMPAKSGTNPLSFYMPGTKELVCQSFQDQLRMELTPKTLCDKVTCVTFYKGYASNGVKDMNICIDPNRLKNEFKSLSNRRPSCTFKSYGIQPKIENTIIEFVDPIQKFGKVIHFDDIPIFKNVKSNANYISVYDPSFFDEDNLDKLIPIFEWPITATVRDHKSGEDKDIVIKGLKKAKAIANNPKRYTPVTPIFQLKKNAKVSDIIDISGFSDLDFVRFRDNGVALLMAKSPERSMLNCEPEPLKPHTHQQTKDGFYVYLQYDK